MLLQPHCSVYVIIRVLLLRYCFIRQINWLIHWSIDWLIIDISLSYFDHLSASAYTHCTKQHLNNFLRCLIIDIVCWSRTTTTPRDIVIAIVYIVTNLILFFSPAAFGWTKLYILVLTFNKIRMSPLFLQKLLWRFRGSGAAYRCLGIHSVLCNVAVINSSLGQVRKMTELKNTRCCKRNANCS